MKQEIKLFSEVAHLYLGCTIKAKSQTTILYPELLIGDQLKCYRPQLRLFTDISDEEAFEFAGLVTGGIVSSLSRIDKSLHSNRIEIFCDGSKEKIDVLGIYWLTWMEHNDKNGWYHLPIHYYMRAISFLLERNFDLHNLIKHGLADNLCTEKK